MLLWNTKMPDRSTLEQPRKEGALAAGVAFRTLTYESSIRNCIWNQSRVRFW
jgi:hypothetical protein